MDGDAGGFVEAEFVEAEDLKGLAMLGANLVFRDDGRTGVVGLAGVAGKDEAAGTGNK